MLIDQLRLICAKTGCRLLKYREAQQATVRLPDGGVLAIQIGEEIATMSRTLGVLGLQVNLQPVRLWILFELHVEEHHGERLPRREVDAIFLDVLIERLTGCLSVCDAIGKAVTGALDPFDDVRRQLDKLKPLVLCEMYRSD